eukprot:TRINITY_DN1327_c0_g1_i1.p1 TRINITY_DN1327_c0_g1~~TRINITY_DN1327_c0_g1_i1.p1  ORF type:complete len:285 (+),score=75.43 TRINITY_DN1327_c0_g1_i1:85-855(+)
MQCRVTLVVLALATAQVGASVGTEEVAKVEIEASVWPRRQGVQSPPPVALVLLADGVDAWPDLMGAKLHDHPAFMELLPTTLGQWRLPFGTGVKYTCPDSTKIADVCDAWVFFYTCPQVCSSTYQGGLPGKLMLEGWERTQCAPRFVTGAGSGFKHPMGGLRIQLARGETVRFELPGTAEFVAFGIDKDGMRCHTYLDASTCPVSTGRCAWRDGACKLVDCRSTAAGPGLPCPECPWEGVISRGAPVMFIPAGSQP